MATNLKTDDGLIAEALKLSGFRTKREAVILALQEFLNRRKQLLAMQLESSIEFDPDYDYKKQRLNS